MKLQDFVERPLELRNYEIPRRLMAPPFDFAQAG
jgi:hypothetical protein